MRSRLLVGRIECSSPRSSQMQQVICEALCPQIVDPVDRRGEELNLCYRGSVRRVSVDVDRPWTHLHITSQLFPSSNCKEKKYI
jgi:hypothetical protein